MGHLKSVLGRKDLSAFIMLRIIYFPNYLKACDKFEDFNACEEI